MKTTRTTAAQTVTRETAIAAIDALGATVAAAPTGAERTAEMRRDLTDARAFLRSANYATAQRVATAHLSR